MADSNAYSFTGRTTPTPRRPSTQTPVPVPVPSSHEDVLELDFMCRRNLKSHSILNSTVVGRDGCTPYFHIMTGPERKTVFRTNNGRTVAEIEWHGKDGAAFVEVPNNVMKQRVSQWLAVASDASHRMMIAHGERYMWIPRSDSICMYHWNPAAVGHIPRLLARIEKEGSTVTLEITVEAVNIGLLDVAVVAATVFQSGCTIH
ncbi:hypothetical protein B0H12DRAFT_782254 [Mycena haematopus]|nr:hypothetical protein B0H12DRAFT_782254 [Mycena haematopus]